MKNPPIHQRLMRITIWLAVGCFALGLLCLEKLAAILGSEHIWAKAIIVIGPAVFMWGIFGLIEPKNAGRTWTTLKWICVPILGLMITVALLVWLNQMETVGMNVPTLIDRAAN